MNNSEITAFHEAAHAVAAIRTGLPFDRVSTQPDDAGETDGALHWIELNDELELAMPPVALAVVLLAGPCAEARVRRLRFDRVFSGEAATDDREAVASLGLSDEQFLAASRDALELVERDWGLIQRIADELEQSRVLEFDEVESMIFDEAGG